MFNKSRKVILTAKIKFYETLGRYYISRAYKCTADDMKEERRRWIKRAFKCTNKCANMRADVSK